jgi:hypothetical protein
VSRFKAPQVKGFLSHSLLLPFIFRCFKVSRCKNLKKIRFEIFASKFCKGITEVDDYADKTYTWLFLKRKNIVKAQNSKISCLLSRLYFYRFGQTIFIYPTILFV